MTTITERLASWLAAEPQLTAIVGRLADLHPNQFDKKHLAQERRAKISRRDGL